MEVYNLYEGELKVDPEEPAGYCRQWQRFGDHSRHCYRRTFLYNSNARVIRE